MFFHKMSLAPQSVIDYYLGSEEKFTKPISYQTLLEVSHFHLFAMGMLVLTLTHLLLFTPLAMGPKLWLTGLTFFSALADEGAGCWCASSTPTSPISRSAPSWHWKPAC